MSPQIACVVYGLAIRGLFVLDWDQNCRTSKGLWIPVIWVWIVGSREVSQWLAALGVGEVRTLVSSTAEYPEGSPVDRGIYTFLLLLGLIVLMKRRSLVSGLLRANPAILLCFLYCGASILWADYPDILLKRWIKDLGDVVMLMVVYTEFNRSAAVKRLLKRTGFLLIPLSVLIIKYYPELGKEYKEVSGTAVYSGVSTNKNLLGITCLVFGLGSVWRFLSACRAREDTHRIRRMIAHAALLAMTLWLFWQANSLTSFSCFLLASLLIVVTSLSALVRKRASVHLLVAGAVSACLCTLFFGFGKFALDTMGRDPTLPGRTELWDLVLSLTGYPVFGTGFESFWLGPRLARIWSIYWWHPNEAHNGYLEVYLNLGWVMLVLLPFLISTGNPNFLNMP